MDNKWASITVEGEVEIHDGIPTLEQMQATVGGYIEAVEIGDAIMWVNEEGKLSGLTPNNIATDLAEPGRWIFEGDYIAGDVLLTGLADDDGETTGLSASWIETLSKVE
jgi:Domain of unknown function (DUF3846)